MRPRILKIMNTANSAVLFIFKDNRTFPTRNCVAVFTNKLIDVCLRIKQNELNIYLPVLVNKLMLTLELLQSCL